MEKKKTQDEKKEVSILDPINLYWIFPQLHPVLYKDHF